MANNSIQDLSPKKHHWTSKVSNEEEEEEDDLISINHAAAAVIVTTNEEDTHQRKSGRSRKQEARRKLQAVAVSRLKSMLTMLGRNRRNIFFLHHHHHHHNQGLGTRLVGTLFGFRSGHVHLALQKDPVSRPVFLVELATPIAGLVREMASGLVRIALECDKEEKTMRGAGKPLLEEPVWRTYCNGKKCGFAARRETGEKEWEVLKAVEPISMGAGVLPANNSDSDDKGGEGGGGGEIMYMRAKFERVVGSRDSEALYMMNPDSHGAPELSIYLLRI